MERCTSTAGEEEEMKLPAIVEDKYKTYLAEQKYEIVRRMSNIDRMAQEFLQHQILNERETMKIFQRPLLHQKAEALLDALINSASFKDVLIVMMIFSKFHNRTAFEYFLAIHNQIATKEKYDHGLIVGSKEYNERHEIEVHDVPTDSTDRASQEELVGEADGVRIEMVKLFGPEINDPDERNSNQNRGARAIIDNAYIYEFEAALKEVQSMSDLIDCPKTGCETSLHYALYHFDNQGHKAMKMILERFEELLDMDGTSANISLADFINMKGGRGNETALCMAIRFKDTLSVRLLYRDYGADIFIKDVAGQSPLEMMYLHFPEEVFLILDSSLKSCAKSPLTGKMVIGADFRLANMHLLATQIRSYLFIQSDSGVLGDGMIHSPGSEDWDEKRDKKDYSKNDLSFLANVVNTSSKRQKLYLPHPLIVLFLLIQWRRYKEWILASAVMQISLKILYAVLVVHVFLHSCRYDPPTTETPPENVNVTESNSSAPSVVGRRYYSCEVDMVWKVLAGILAFFGGVLILHEFAELKCKISAALKTSVNGNIIRNIFSGLKNYIYDLENVFQLLCATLILYICVEVIQGMFAGFDYAIASVSIVLVSVLILIELGNFPWFSVYIQIFIKVTKSFTKFLSLYGVLIIAFSISFSIAFPKEAEFKSLLEAVPRMIIMMAGEVEYREIVYSTEPKMFATGQIVFACFVLIMSFILTNLLIGLVVSDVKELTEESQVVAMSVTLERCYTMAHTLRLRYWRWILLPLKMIVGVSYSIIRKLEAQSDGEMASLDAERKKFELEPWHTMKLGPNSRIAVLQLPETLQEKIEKLLQRQPGTSYKEKN